jgi:hypothetical protein
MPVIPVQVLNTIILAQPESQYFFRLLPHLLQSPLFPSSGKLSPEAKGTQWTAVNL